MTKKWSEKEDNLLRKYALKMSLKECADMLGRSLPAIKVRASRIGIKKKKLIIEPPKQIKKNPEENQLIYKVWGITRDELEKMTKEDRSKLCLNCSLDECINCFGSLVN